MDAERLATDGWYVTDVLPRPVVDGLASHFRALAPDTLESFWASSVMAPRDLAREIDQDLKRIVGPYLRAVVPGHHLFLAAVIAKGAGTDGSVAFHQDWTFTDERHGRTVLCWMPLVDTSDAAGAMRVVPGSHRWSEGVRPSGEALPTDPFPDELQARLAERAVTVPMRAGQGLVYDPAIVHGSWPNGADHDRLAVNVALAPEGEPIVHFHLDRDAGLRGHRVDEAHFTTEPFASVPGGDTFDPWAPMVTLDDIAAGLDALPTP